MKKHPEIFFGHMLLAIESIEDYLKGLNCDEFTKDRKSIDAVIRQLEILGEAAGKIPKHVVEDSPIQWSAITGMRNKLIHDYFGVDVEIVWKTASKGLDELRLYLKKKLNR